MRSNSPLRYPGGKSQLFPVLEPYFLNVSVDTFIEPFAGGAGLGIELLLKGRIKRLVLNDMDKGIYHFWEAVFFNTESLIRKIENAKISVDEWAKQKQIRLYSSDALEQAFATLFLNRTCFSGILNAGPIGGREQKGKYKIDSRFNKQAVIEKIINLSKYKEKVSIKNMDAIDLMKSEKVEGNNLPLYFLDPPYMGVGDSLYPLMYSLVMHKELCEYLIYLKSTKWILTYSNKEEVKEAYKSKPSAHLIYRYSLAKKTNKTEVIYFSDNLKELAKELINKKDSQRSLI